MHSTIHIMEERKQLCLKENVHHTSHLYYYFVDKPSLQLSEGIFSIQKYIILMQYVFFYLMLST